MRLRRGGRELALRTLMRTVACAFAAAVIFATVGCGYETGPPDYLAHPEFRGGESRG
jgi:hypothetical protein